jgi:hypothetical protein
MHSSLKVSRPSGQSTEQSDYLSYLLRLWRMPGDEAGHASDGERPAWRASLDSPHTGERLGFASMDEMFGFLQAQAGTVPAADGNCGEG